MVCGSQAREEFDIVHDLNGVLAAVGNGGFVIEVAVSRAQDVGATDDGGGDNVVIVRIMRDHAKHVPLGRFNADGGGPEECYGSFYLLVIEPVHGPQSRVAEHPAQFVQEKSGDDENVWRIAEPAEAFFGRATHTVDGASQHVGVEERPHH